MEWLHCTPSYRCTAGLSARGRRYTRRDFPIAKCYDWSVYAEAQFYTLVPSIFSHRTGNCTNYTVYFIYDYTSIPPPPSMHLPFHSASVKQHCLHEPSALYHLPYIVYRMRRHFYKQRNLEMLMQWRDSLMLVSMSTLDRRYRHWFLCGVHAVRLTFTTAQNRYTYIYTCTHVYMYIYINNFDSILRTIEFLQ